ncbi:MAG TPA: helix-turn-helix domain-containing protein [Candidatus Limnocylindrales bacterium]|nr:helix-turn-helix domain-containing protein [Candidatus Limnocylindrales bacterium]
MTNRTTTLARGATGAAQRFYTPQEVAHLLAVSPTTVMARIHDGALPAIRVSERVYRIPVAAFERFVSTEPAPVFDVRYRRVKRVRKLGEPIVAVGDLVRT